MIVDPELTKGVLSLLADDPHWPSRLKLGDVQKAFPERSRQEITFHLKCCNEEGLLDATIERTKTFEGVAYRVGNIDGLTQKGSEFVLAARNPRIWASAIGKCKDMVGHVSLSLLVEAASSSAKQMLSSA